jgi:hypothetical protein|tara:strand:- start:401 stop:646 length:246 start_codon:yes stop_codon:yes gene_type:complete
MSNVIQNEVLTKIEKKLDKSISDLTKFGNVVFFDDGSEKITGDKKIIKIIDDLEGIKQIIILDDLERMGGQIKWLDKKGDK